MLGAPLESLLEEIYFEELDKTVTKSEAIIIKKSKKPPTAQEQRRKWFIRVQETDLPGER